MKKLPEGFKTAKEYQTALAKSGYSLPDVYFASYQEGSASEAPKVDTEDKATKTRKATQPSETKDASPSESK